LGDIAGRINVDSGDDEGGETLKEKVLNTVISSRNLKGIFTFQNL
jgi:hypothetical protein